MEFISDFRFRTDVCPTIISAALVNLAQDKKDHLFEVLLLSKNSEVHFKLIQFRLHRTAINYSTNGTEQNPNNITCFSLPYGIFKLFSSTCLLKLIMRQQKRNESNPADITCTVLELYSRPPRRLFRSESALCADHACQLDCH